MCPERASQSHPASKNQCIPGCLGSRGQPKARGSVVSCRTRRRCLQCEFRTLAADAFAARLTVAVSCVGPGCHATAVPGFCSPTNWQVLSGSAGRVLPARSGPSRIGPRRHRGPTVRRRARGSVRRRSGRGGPNSAVRTGFAAKPPYRPGRFPSVAPGRARALGSGAPSADEDLLAAPGRSRIQRIRRGPRDGQWRASRYRIR